MKKLLENTAALYVMKFAGYFLSLATIPYQTRVLSQECYGGLNLAMGVMLYFQLVIDFGFMVTGVSEVAERMQERHQLNRIVTGILAFRVGLSVVCLGVLTVLLYLIDSYALWREAFYIYFLATVLESLLPAFFLRGMEDMRTVAVLTLLSKLVVTGLVFLFVKSDAQYLFIPWSRVLGAAVSLVIALAYIRRKYGIRFVPVPVSEVMALGKRASGYFISRIAGAVYRSGNVALLGLGISAEPIAIYSTAEKLMNVGMTMSTPVSDSLLPHIAKTKDYRSAWKLIKVAAPFILAGGAIGFIFAESIVVFLFGQDYAASAPVLRIMIPIIAITLPNYIIAFPVLVPMGLGRQTNMANVAGTLVYILGTGLCWITDCFDIYSAAAILLITELTVMLWRLVILYRYRDMLKGEMG